MKPDIIFADFYDLCITGKHEPTKQNLVNKRPILKLSANTYDANALLCKLHEISALTNDKLLPLTKKDLENLYDQRMVNGPGRSIYDQLLVSAKKDGCCFCSYEEPTELDHFLPKTVFPEFSILPFNLIPICHRCNKLKSTYVPEKSEKSYIHPYYEICDSMIWLNAVVNFELDAAPTVTYHIAEEIADSDPDLAKRIQFQFKELQLNYRYSLRATIEISGIAYKLEKLFADGGKNNVCNYLKEEAESREEINQNSWQTALYNCLYRSDEFCNVGWSL